MDQIIGLLDKIMSSPALNAMVWAILAVYIIIAGIVAAVFVYVLVALRNHDKRFKGMR